MTTLVLFALLSIIFSFLCSIWEAVLLSVTPTFLTVKKKAGVSWASKLEKMKENVDQPLIAILTLNTIAHTVGAIGVGANAEAAFGKSYWFDFLSVPEVVVPSVMTILILVASEIIPKTIGATYWKGLAGFTTVSLDWLVKFLKYTGILFILQLFTKIIGKGKKKSIFSRQDFSVMTEMGEKSGALKKEESVIIKGLLGADKISIEDIMTPKNVVLAGAAEDSMEDFYKKHDILRFSRIPIYENDNRDTMDTYILKDTLQENIIKGKGAEPLKVIERKLLNIDEKTPLSDLYKTFKENGEHIAMAVDEFGQAQGIVTMEDVVETLLGLEIVDEYDNVEDMRAYARQKWEERASKRGLSVQKKNDNDNDNKNQKKGGPKEDLVGRI